MRKQIINELRDMVDGLLNQNGQYEVEVDVVRKNNSVEMNALTIRKDRSSIRAVAYVDFLVDEYLAEKRTLMDTAKKIVFDYFKQSEERCEMIENYSEILNNKERLLDCVEMKIVNKSKNSIDADTVPHKDFLDLMVVYRAIVNRNEDDMASFMVSNSLMEMLNISFEELDEAATMNTKERA